MTEQQGNGGYLRGRLDGHDKEISQLRKDMVSMEVRVNGQMESLKVDIKEIKETGNQNQSMLTTMAAAATASKESKEAFYKRADFWIAALLLVVTVAQVVGSFVGRSQ